MSLQLMTSTPWVLACVMSSLLLPACARDEPAPAAAATTSRSTPASAPRVEPVAVRPRIVFLGDSLTAGLGLSNEESVPALVARRLEEEGYEYDVINAGVSGDTSAGGLSRLEWSLEGDVRVLVIELGGNDGLRGLPVAGMKRNIGEIIARARKRSIAVVLTGMEAPPNYGAAYTSEFRQAFRDLAREHDVTFVPFFLDGVAGVPALNQGDGIHPNAEGARIIERTIWQTLEPLLAKAETTDE
jgi:acyl-CoA thioesterase-1